MSKTENGHQWNRHHSTSHSLRKMWGTESPHQWNRHHSIFPCLCKIWRTELQRYCIKPASFQYKFKLFYCVFVSVEHWPAAVSGGLFSSCSSVWLCGSCLSSSFVVRVALWIMSVFKLCSNSGFVARVCLQALW